MPLIQITVFWMHCDVILNYMAITLLNRAGFLQSLSSNDRLVWKFDFCRNAICKEPVRYTPSALLVQLHAHWSKGFEIHSAIFFLPPCPASNLKGLALAESIATASHWCEAVLYSSGPRFPLWRRVWVGTVLSTGSVSETEGRVYIGSGRDLC